jgi:hypothetical protein
VFPAESEERAAGCEDLQFGTVTEQLAQVARRCEHLLEIVQHEQKTPPSQVLT